MRISSSTLKQVRLSHYPPEGALREHVLKKDRLRTSPRCSIGTRSSFSSTCSPLIPPILPPLHPLRQSSGT